MSEETLTGEQIKTALENPEFRKEFLDKYGEDIRIAALISLGLTAISRILLLDEKPQKKVKRYHIENTPENKKASVCIAKEKILEKHSVTYNMDELYTVADCTYNDKSTPSLSAWADRIVYFVTTAKP